MEEETLNKYDKQEARQRIQDQSDLQVFICPSE